jgi:flagellar motility protein MotE (MotC chaperone)
MPRLRVLPVAIVAACLLLSVKLGDIWRTLDGFAPSVDVARPAIAEENAVAAEESGQVKAVAASVDPAEPEGVSIANLSPSDLELLQRLAERRQQLDARARDLDTREQALALAERRLDGKLQELKALKDQFEALVVERDESHETQLRSLVKIYENMKPKDAAPIFDQLDMPILLDVIERMKEAKVAPILALMNPDRARQVTQDLAVRREMPPPGG